jgi:hypothetical protein
MDELAAHCDENDIDVKSSLSSIKILQTGFEP